MNLRFYAICTAILLALEIPALGVPFIADNKITATVHGATYASDTLEPLNDTVININSNPPQSIVAKNGMYSFELVPGDYTITASCYHKNILTYYKEISLNIESEGNYVFDLLLYPVADYPATQKIADKTSNINSADPTGQARTDSPTIRYLPVVLTLFLLLGGGYKFSRKHKKMEKSRFQEGTFNIPGLLLKGLGKSTGYGVGQEFGNIGKTASVTEPLIEHSVNSGTGTAAPKELPLSTDLSEVLDVIRGHKGRITQKDLRSRLKYSEVKVSLLLSELEKRELIKKFKNGRENIVILMDEKR
jgi:uncharacterized membrane protein